MILFQYLPALASGLLTTVLLALAALVLGGSLACLMTLLSLSKYLSLKVPVEIFIFCIRGTPLLVQIFLIYFGLGQFELIRASPVWVILQEPFACALIALALNTSAYTTVLLKGAIASVPKTEVIACEALGMSYALAMRRIIFPRAVGIVLPAYSNEVVIVLKGTSLVSTITILDLMGATNQIIAQTYDTLPFLCLAGAIYLALNITIMRVFHYVERRWGVA